MVWAYHVIITVYGFWLPNDPRGSWSNEVWAPLLIPFGAATKTETRRSVAHRTHDAMARREAKTALLYPPVSLTGLQIQAVGDGFAEIVRTLGLCLWACAIMTDHAHLVVARHGEKIETLAGFLKRAATRRMNAEGCNPLAEYRDWRDRIPSPWAEHGWFRYLNDAGAIRQAIRYVEGNPEKVDLPRQHWPFVVPFEGI